MEPPPSDQAPPNGYGCDQKAMTYNCRALGEALTEVADKLGDESTEICIQLSNL